MTTAPPDGWADDLPTVELAGRTVPVITANTVVVGTGSAGYCAAERLWDLGQTDVVMVTDNRGAGSSRNAGSDKQTYYKLTLSGGDADSVGEMAQTLFSGGAMDGDTALVEAALSARAFIRLCDLGVPFPQNRFGEFVGYRTDHDPRRRATSVGPYTSRSMVEQLEKRVARNGTRVFDHCRVVDLVVHDGAVAGLLVLRRDLPLDGDRSPFALLRCTNVVYATGGPAGMYATRVFPNGQWGASGAPYRAGVRGKNLTEWQFGLASVRPRWNVSGSYMQVMPRFVSTDENGDDAREFLTEAIDDYGRLLSLVFLKGYQWPFDIRKARDGSSLVDLLVYRETVLRGRRVWLDFTANPVRPELDASAISPEAREYLERAGALFGTPVQRLRQLNEPAYQFFLNRNQRVDLETERLEVDVCVQHNNGGLLVDAWWRSNLTGFFPVGEAGGAHGVYRPGGSALNSGQVGATRAAQYIAAQRVEDPFDEPVFAAAAEPVLAAAVELLSGATARHAEGGDDDNTSDLLRQVQRLMSEKAGPVRSAESIRDARKTVGELLLAYDGSVVADGGSRRSVDRVFLLRDIIVTAHVYLGAMSDYLDHGGRSRGSVLYTDPAGSLPEGGDLPEDFRFRLDAGALDDEVQEVALLDGAEVECTWRPRRPMPDLDDFFENVWREFRDRGGVY
ncbi:FAD-binding protein [Kineosporia sp. J2-2]|uniref:FAD-binding protein n=1 Tax=Kineosporia corallincola TaxID=2835133 RepID=A0ABS5TRV1_9ACTN|nr:FAD-binding protein [Kineosporia corallincola]MBT0773531.1 FAD-binding protein [Kineosporia corallincola]